MASSLTLALTISGTIGKFPLEQIDATYTLSGQTVAEGPKEILVPAAAAMGTVDVCLEPLAEQNLLLIFSDKKVFYRINGDGVDREINENGFAIHPGDPVITELAFGGNGSQNASVTVLRLGLSGAVPGGGILGGSFQFEDLGPAILAQTDFPLAAIPAQPSRLLLFVNGVMWSVASGSVAVVTSGAGAPKVVWSGAPMAGGERVEAVY